MLEAAEQALAGARFCGELAQQVIGQGGLAALAVGGLDQPPGFVPAVAGELVLGGMLGREGLIVPQHAAGDLTASSRVAQGLGWIVKEQGIGASRLKRRSSYSFVGLKFSIKSEKSRAIK